MCKDGQRILGCDFYETCSISVYIVWFYHTSFTLSLLILQWKFDIDSCHTCIFLYHLFFLSAIYHCKDRVAGSETDACQDREDEQPCYSSQWYCGSGKVGLIKGYPLILLPFESTMFRSLSLQQCNQQVTNLPIIFFIDLVHFSYSITAKFSKLILSVCARACVCACMCVHAQAHTKK